MPEEVDLQDLLKSGAHFGHLTRRWNPKMKDFIFMERNGIHIIDLKKTKEYLDHALEHVTRLARAGKTILFVGTKKQAQDIVKTEAIRCGMPYVTHRWLGGMMTNFTTVRKSISRMEEIDRMQDDGTYDELTKKERLMLDREKDKLEQTLGGIANMNHLPGAVFVVDTIKENIAVKEAVKLHIPLVALVDTNSDPDIPDYIVPCNDDSARTIQMITSLVADAVIEGTAEREAQNEEELLQKAAEEAEEAEKKSKKGRKPKEEIEVKDQKKSTGKRRTRKKKKKADKSSEESDKKKDDKKEAKEDNDSEESTQKKSKKKKAKKSDDQDSTGKKAKKKEKAEAEKESADSDDDKKKDDSDSSDEEE